MAVDIRPARASDVDALRAIEEASFPSDRLARRSFRQLIGSPSAIVVVAEDEGAIAGYSVLLFRRGSSSARLYSIATATSFSGTGVGRSLLVQAELEVRRRSGTVLRLEVRQDNHRAMAIYERAGFRKTGIVPSFYEDGMAAIRMSKEIADPKQSGSALATLSASAPLSGAAKKISRQTVR